MRLDVRPGDVTASPAPESGRGGAQARRTATAVVIAKRSEPGMPDLVTGATGLLGSHLTDLLLERGEQVRVLVQRGDGMRRFAHPHVEICWGHLGDRAALAAAVRGVDRVLNCAARTGPWGMEAGYEAFKV